MVCPFVWFAACLSEDTMMVTKYLKILGEFSNPSTTNVNPTAVSFIKFNDSLVLENIFLA